MPIRYFPILAAFLMGLPFLRAQQLPLATQYTDNQMLFNPAAFHTDYFLSKKFYTSSFGTSFRRQWSRRQNAPSTGALRGETIIKPRGERGVGLIAGGYMLYDQSGPLSFTGIHGRLAGTLNFDRYGNTGLNFGLNFGAVQYRLRATEVRFYEPDPLGDEDQSRLTPDVGAGLFFHSQLPNQDIFYAGISVPQLFALDLTGRPADEFALDRVPHYYASIGFFKFFNNLSSLHPHVWLKYAPNAPFNADFNLRYQLNANFWLGAGAGTSGLMHLETGLALEEWLGDTYSLRIGYGTDFFLNAAKSPFGMTHEINLTAMFGKK